MAQLIFFILLIGLFIYGMTLLRSGLMNLSANSLKKWLVKLTNAPWKGVIIGTLITAVLQSSSAVMIITIGLISARMLSFPQSIGIILGTNIGTTFTTELITFNIESYIIPLAVIGAILALTKKKNLRSTGFILLGISCVFAAMRGFEYFAGTLKNIEIVNRLLLTLDENLLYGVAAGILITAIIQSSTATTGIIMGFLTAGSMDLDTGIAIMLGSNIGTCVDAYLASIGSGKEAKLSAYAHIWLNIIGVIVFYPFIGMLTSIGLQLAAEVDVQLAHISVIFNVVTSLLVLPFATPFGKFIMKIHDR
ncbi:Na/Pi symporter [Cytobacillus sp. FJAT-53684]|uniref:Na/Pi symporter n=1 Tax=Cytobacillus mangrovibacter TaxID=3299024 RepID=A0ABW6K180_9BACI